MKLLYYLDDDAIITGCTFDKPRDGDAGYDICSCRSVYLYGMDNRRGNYVNKSNNRAIISTGLHVQIPEGFVGLIKDRSSMAAKALTISGGVIDSSYRGEIKVIMQNNHYGGYQIEPGTKIAQMIVVPVLDLDTHMVDSLDELDETERGEQGFGSTDT